MGSIGRVRVHYVDLKKWFSELNIPVLAADMHGIPVNEVQVKSPSILLIGNEGSGISEELKEYISQTITIPRIGEAESLNAAVACGILVHQISQN
jgi:TrmH family RNA methyltransferase